MPEGMKPHELADRGLIPTLSMADYQPDQRLVDEALGNLDDVQVTQQGGDSVAHNAKFVPTWPPQPGSNRSSVPGRADS